MTEEKQLENQETKKENLVKRPWQANVWVFMVMFGCLLFLVGSLIDFASGYEESVFVYVMAPFYIILMFNANSLILLMGLFFDKIELTEKLENIVLITWFIALVILSIFLIRGFLKGKKWSIIFSLLSSLLGLIFLWQTVFDPIDGMLADYDFSISFIMIISFLFGAYLEVSCLKHPYYNQKKINQNKDE